MKLKLTVILALAIFCSICSARPAEADYEYEDEPAPPPKPVSRPLVGRRNPLIRAGGTSKSTTTTTTAAPEPQENEEEIADEEPLEEQEVPVETSSTTEPGRKLKGGVVRPFRSNEDLLAALKKRREQAILNKNHLKTQVHEPQESSPVASEAEKPVASSKTRASSGRRKFNKNESANQESEPGTSAPARTNRRFRN